MDLDEINDFFRYGGDRVLVPLSASERENKRELERRDRLREREREEDDDNDENNDDNDDDNDEDDDDDDDDYCDDYDEVESLAEDVERLQVYRKYQFEAARERVLPIDRLKKEILWSIESKPVTIIEGPTGCGKTTQVPTWILQDSCEKRRYCNVIVTQPRRIAAMSVAKRVAKELACRVGELVGYKVGLNKATSEDTRLQYVTTGVLLNEIVATKSLNAYTHIVLDEVHERDQEMDFLLIVIKKLLKKDMRNVKVIMMSATFNVRRFSEYFAMKIDGQDEPNPVISLKAETLFQAPIFYSESLTSIGVLPNVDYDRPELSRRNLEFATKLLNAFETIDEREEKGERPCVLVFLPGYSDIEEFYNILTSDMMRSEIDPEKPLYKWWLVPLHSTITVDEQAKAFQTPPIGYRKIILATNIAESSITVPDVKYVIDFCLTKIMVCNEGSQFSSLRLSWASQANCIQRAGRAGRIRPGRVYRLVPKTFYEEFPEELKPEMQRTSIASLILHTKTFNMGTPKRILALAMDPPNLVDIRKNVLLLKEVGALYKTVSGKYIADDGDITPLGVIMEKLPLNMKSSKLIVLGYIFGCLEECIIIGAALTTKNVFSSPFVEKMYSFDSKLTWAHGSMSDSIALLHVYRAYENELSKSKDQKHIQDWAKASYLQLKALRELERLVTEIKIRLKSLNIDLEKESNHWDQIKLTLVLKMIMAGAFYPNYFINSSEGENNEHDATRTLNGKNPFNTVYLNCMDNRHPGELYTRQLKHLLKPCSSGNVIFDFDKNSSKILVSFPSTSLGEGNDKVPGKISMPVYRAIKMRHMKMPLVLRVMPLRASLEYAEKLGINTCSQSSISNHNKRDLIDKLPQYIVPRLPTIDESFISLKILEINAFGPFWAKSDDSVTEGEHLQIRHLLNFGNPKDLKQLTTEVELGKLYIALVDNEYFRAIVEQIKRKQVQVRLIDEGKRCRISVKDLFLVGQSLRRLQDIRPIAFQWVLSEIAPAHLQSSKDFAWSMEAMNRIKQLTCKTKLHGKVYSVTYGIVSLELFSNNVSINETLLNEKLAVATEESYASMMNRDLREKADLMQPTDVNIYNNIQTMQNVEMISDYLEPDRKECIQSIMLKGPFSPLEINLYSLFNTGVAKCVRIEDSSVNSVLLNTTPQATFERLLIAADISESQSGGTFILRNTTMMPNIPGFLTIITLIFCPYVELRCDIDKSVYVAALCGLGHLNGRAIFPEHDILVNINIELTKEDLININKLRHIMNRRIISMECQSIPEDFKHATKNSIDELIHRLFTIERRQHDIPPHGDAWKWNSTSEHRMIMPKKKDIDTGEDVYPLHCGIDLSASNIYLTNLSNKNAKLHKIVEDKTAEENKFDSYNCDLCGIHLSNISSLRLHLHSKMHREQESNLPRVKSKC